MVQQIAGRLTGLPEQAKADAQGKAQEQAKQGQNPAAGVVHGDAPAAPAA